MIDTISEFLKRHKPKAVLIPYEKGSYGLAMIIACKKNRIKTIGLQHGAFDSIMHNDYSYTSIQSNENPFGIPIPDHTLVWGHSAKNFLINKGYPEKNVSVLGNPEFFNLDAIKKDKEILRQQYDIPLNKTVILFTTSKLQLGYIKEEKRAYDEQVLKELLKSFSNDPNYLIIVKPHPVREPIYRYQKIIEGSAKNCVINQNNVLDLIQLSDVVVSVESSTIIDAIALGKMVVEVTFDDSSWMDPNEAMKILVLSNLSNLKSNIHEVLNNPKIQQKLKNGQKKFLRDHYNIPSTDTYEILKNVIN